MIVLVCVLLKNNFFLFSLAGLKRCPLNQDIFWLCANGFSVKRSQRRGFLRVTAHWLTHDLKRKSYALACQRFKGTFKNCRPQSKKLLIVFLKV